MELTDGDIVIFSLTASIAMPRRGDFMATVKVASGQIEAEYRFRWWRTADKLDMDGGADDDVKSFFRVGPVVDTPENRERIKNALRRITAGMPGFSNVHEQAGEWTPQQFIYEVIDKSPMRTQLTRETT